MQDLTDTVSAIPIQKKRNYNGIDRAAGHRDLMIDLKAATFEIAVLGLEGLENLQLMRLVGFVVEIGHKKEKISDVLSKGKNVLLK